jgi:hypothetical protein
MEKNAIYQGFYWPGYQNPNAGERILLYCRVDFYFLIPIDYA